MIQFQPKTIRIVACLLVVIALGACGTAPPATSQTDWYLEQFAPGEFASLSIDERLNVMADLCPAGTKPYCHVRPERDQCSCIEDDQMRRNLEAFIR